MRDLLGLRTIDTRITRAMTARRWLSGGLLGVLLVATGCGADDSPDPPQSASPSTTSPATTSEAPIPEEEAVEAATQAFEDFLRVSDAASREPGAQDWEPEIRRYAADPAALLTVQSVRDYATLGLRQEGDSAVDVQVAGVDLAAPEGPTVRITGCYDSQSTQRVNAETGEVVPPGTPPRYVWDITVIQYLAEPREPWLVTTLNPLTDQPC